MDTLAIVLDGSTRRFAESVAGEQREKGLMGKGLKYGLHQLGGPILDPRKVNKMLVGTKVPTIFALVDVCLDCGTLYAVRLEKGEVSLKGVLVRRESTSLDMAGEIAERLDGRSQDVRDAVRVARLAPQLGVERAIQLLLGE